MCTRLLFRLLTGLPNRLLILMRFYSVDEGFKSSFYLPEALLDPEFGHAYESNKTAFNKAFNTKEDMWTWAEFPENKTRLVRFASAMNGLKNISPRETILEGSATLRGFCTPLSHL
jgi:hypothetical protein